MTRAFQDKDEPETYIRPDDQSLGQLLNQGTTSFADYPISRTVNCG